MCGIIGRRRLQRMTPAARLVAGDDDDAPTDWWIQTAQVLLGPP